ncbi:winged helix DNA-binding protein [Lysinibacillus agricola]|uniref:Winged helix DNA-binding protein n=1 Tax=Lysinibacillus agricola TaxID=2590012 RepID=A0ABX7AQT4_9BACI|nr:MULTISPECIES: winged helix DNA-binding protein [Lysinibacillus]KOS59964.1 MarR family transcriptional regulator [Lysinibacillus sp. FJAT-14222]QQP11966.1 winged helix DNA-binding protein [Lysinibacillus agricola]
MMFDSQYRKDNRSARMSMALFRISQAIKKMTQAESDALGLSPVQTQGLLFAAYTRSDMATVGNFASTIGTTHVTAVKILNRLVEKKLIYKIQKADDRRVTLISLTEKGQKVISNLDDWEQSLEDALQSLPENVLSHLELGLGSVVSTLQKKGHLVVSEPCLGCIYFRPSTGEKTAPHYCQLIQKYLTHEASLKECPEHTAF